MKKQITKILSIVLSIAVVLSVCGMLGVFNANATDAEKITDYYVGYGGTGDGSSLDKMAPNVATAIKTINANGLTAADTANIWIVQTITAVENKGAVGNTAYHNLAYWSDDGTVDAHAAKLVIKPHANNSGLATTYLFAGDLVGNQDEFILGGTTRFEGLKLVFMHLNVGRFGVIANGNLLEYASDVTFGYVNRSGANAGSWTAASHLRDINIVSPSLVNTGTTDKATKIIFDKDTSYGDGRVYIPGATGGTYTVNNDMTVEFARNVNKTYIAVGASNTTSNITVGDINIKIKSGTIRFRNYNDTKTENICSNVKTTGLHLIFTKKVGVDSSYPLTNMTGYCFKADGVTPADLWKITIEEADYDKIDFIEGGETGKFKVAAGYKATATNKATNATVDSNSGVLDLSKVPGEYTVVFTEQAEKVYEYYVKAGGTGSGTDINNPAPNVATAIEKMNNLGLDATETATVYIMQDIAEFQRNEGTNYKHNLAYWGGKVDHQVKVVIKPHPDNQKVNTAITRTYLASASEYCNNGDLFTIGGPTYFEDITLVYTSKSHFNNDKAIIIANGNDVSFNENIGWGNFAVNSASNSWPNYTKPSVNYSSVGFPAALVADGITEPVKSPVNMIIKFNTQYGGNRVNIPAYGNGTYVFEKDVTVEMTGDNNKTYVSVVPKSQASNITYNQNLNFKFNGYVRFNNNGTAKNIVKGGLQLIISKDANVNDKDYPISKLTDTCYKEDGTTAADTWRIDVANDDMGYVNFINGETGKFTAVKEGYTAVAFKDGQLVEKAENGVLDLSDEGGTYEIQFLKAVDFDLDGDFDFDTNDCAYLKAKLLDDADFIKDYDVNNDNAFNICDVVFLYEKLA